MTLPMNARSIPGVSVIAPDSASGVSVVVTRGMLEGVGRSGRRTMATTQSPLRRKALRLAAAHRDAERQILANAQDRESTVRALRYISAVAMLVDESTADRPEDCGETRNAIADVIAARDELIGSMSRLHMIHDSCLRGIEHCSAQELTCKPPSAAGEVEAHKALHGSYPHSRNALVVTRPANAPNGHRRRLPPRMPGMT